MAPPSGPIRDFLDKVDVLITDVASSKTCMVLAVEKSYSLYSEEASFTIRVRFKRGDWVNPDAAL